ncbi:DUF3822 family protein [Pareuzebyella sediminis]|uniref:DUF3822 family protein n=1 Tax=Pareuzebyella sediminis TaxID=2607998 RepID=UPI0011EE7075|nr:DUF3822 family protein [Pareuzebyella sediminis]
MTKKEINRSIGKPNGDFNKLSIQVSLNGLYFCVLDTLSSKIVRSEHTKFPRELTPYEALRRLKDTIVAQNIDQAHYSEVVVVHSNGLFGFVPKSLFDPKELANYLKLNTKILANDFLAYDELENYDMVNVYVPFVNINNYIYDLFGEFTFKHSGTVMVESLLKGHKSGKETVCYAYVSEKKVDITIISQKKLLLFNSYTYASKEDFLYYLLFTLEQLGLDTESISLKLFGDIEEDDHRYELCYRYIKNISIFIPDLSHYPLANTSKEAIDFTVINAI